mgnify:CR=1 FL=1
MIRSFFRHGRKRKAQEAFAKAKAAYDDAKARGDTRDMSFTGRAVADAMTALLRAETVKVVRR